MTFGQAILLTFLSLFLGWVLGLLSPIINDWIKNRRKKKEVKRGILTELKDIKYRLTAVVFQISKKYGSLNRELLSWMLPIVENYDGDLPKEPILKPIIELLKLSDAEIARVSQSLKSEKESALSFKKYELPFLDSKIDYISLFNIELQRKLIEIRNQANFLHEEIDEARYFFQMTFDSTISNENYEAACLNLKKRHLSIAGLSRGIVNRIEKLESDENNPHRYFLKILGVIDR